jgi:ABC-type sugar transport system substrate-binding protein
VNGAAVSTHIASDDIAGGRMAAALLLKRLGGFAQPRMDERL